MFNISALSPLFLSMIRDDQYDNLAALFIGFLLFTSGTVLVMYILSSSEDQETALKLFALTVFLTIAGLVTVLIMF